MTATLPAGLSQAFRLAVAELGYVTASWLYVNEVRTVGGDALVRRLRDELGRDWPVLDAVAAAALAGAPLVADPTPVVEACTGAARIVVVGIETAFLDRLVEALPDVRFTLVRQSVFGPDWERVSANYRGRVELEGLDTFQRHAGPKSVLLTFVYGVGSNTAYALPAWVRTSGEDVRTQFRSLIGWDVLGQGFHVYPRWLVEVPTSTFTRLIP